MVTIIEAVEWMKKGNKAVAPCGLEIKYKEIFYRNNSIPYQFSIQDFEGEWKLLNKQAKVPSFIIEHIKTEWIQGHNNLGEYPEGFDFTQKAFFHMQNNGKIVTFTITLID